MRRHSPWWPVLQNQQKEVVFCCCLKSAQSRSTPSEGRTPVADLLGRKEIFSQPPSPADAHGPRRPTHTPDTASGEPGAEPSLEIWASGSLPPALPAPHGALGVQL